MIDLHLKMGDFPASQTGLISGEYGVLVQIFPFFQFRSAAQGFRNQLAVESANLLGLFKSWGNLPTIGFLCCGKHLLLGYG